MFFSQVLQSPHSSSEVQHVGSRMQVLLIHSSQSLHSLSFKQQSEF